jgi:DNA-binding transcriptional MerR regulator
MPRLNSTVPMPREPVPTPDSQPPDADAAAGRTRTKKAAGAFRTISEVADELHIPQHVLRFWETKFAQIRPLKRGGGRRYYRPDDIALLRRIADLLYIQGYQIKGVQRLLREGGGRLADNIPPPDPAERAGAAEERDAWASGPPPEPELPLPGLAPVSPSPAREAAASTRRASVPEQERLRAVLGRVLLDLEALRAMIG